MNDFRKLPKWVREYIADLQRQRDTAARTSAELAASAISAVNLSATDSEWVVVLGNPVDGISIHGPFKNHIEAMTWTEKADGDWWITTLEDPDDD